MAAGSEQCSWCGSGIPADDGFRLYEPAGDRMAAFCRLEHVVPWGIQGAHCEAGDGRSMPATGPARCSRCDADLGEVRAVLVRHRGEHRVADEFCGVDHLLEWAKAGGRWR
jgi:hypothetical protein